MADWTTTVRQVLPRFFAVAKRLRPTWHARSLADLTPEWLEARGVSLLIWDVDGTLMPWHGTAVDPSLRAGWERLRAAPGLSHLVLSNCGEERFAELGRVLPDVPVVKGYATPAGPAGRRILGGEITWTDGAHREPLTDPAVTTIRKPAAVLVEFALAFADGVAPEKALMVGDQYLTDIAGANEAGVRSVKVRTLGRSSFPFPVACMQRLEAVLFRLFYGRVEELPAGGASSGPAGERG